MAAPPEKSERVNGRPRGGRDDDTALGDHGVVQLLQRLRPHVHVVDGDAVQADRQGARGLRDVPARQGRRRRAPRCTGDRRAGSAGARAEVRVRARSERRSSRCRRTRCATSSRASTPEGGRGGGRGGQRQRRPRRRRANNRAWLDALKSLDFDALSRNAQVDYLYIKWRAETDIAHETETIPPGPAFRARRVEDSRQAARPRGPDLRSARQHDSVHARAAHRAREQGIRLVRGRDEEGARARWASATTGRRRSRRRSRPRCRPAASRA